MRFFYFFTSLCNFYNAFYNRDRNQTHALRSFTSPESISLARNRDSAASSVAAIRKNSIAGPGRKISRIPIIIQATAATIRMILFTLYLFSCRMFRFQSW